MIVPVQDIIQMFFCGPIYQQVEEYRENKKISLPRRMACFFNSATR